MLLGDQDLIGRTAVVSHPDGEWEQVRKGKSLGNHLSDVGVYFVERSKQILGCPACITSLPGRIDLFIMS